MQITTYKSNSHVRFSIACRVFFTLLIFILWPLAGFVFALFVLPDCKERTFFVCSFFVIIGLSIALDNPEVDSYRHAESFMRVCDYGISYAILFTGELPVDYYHWLVKLLVAQFSNNPKILFGVYALVWGLFAYKALLFAYYLSNHSRNKNDFLVLTLLIAFLCNPYITINGVRFGCAAWLFLASYYGECLGNKYWKYLRLLTPFVHLTMVLPIIVLFVSKYFSSKSRWCYIILFSSFVISEILSIGEVTSILQIFPEEFHFNAYVDSQYSSTYVDNAAERSLLTQVMAKMNKYAVFLYTIYLYPNIMKKIKSYNDNVIIMHTSDMFLMLSFLFLCEIVPDASRFSCLVYPMFIVYVANTYKYIKPRISQTSVLFFLLVIFAARIYKEVVVLHPTIYSDMFIKNGLIGIVEEVRRFVF